MANREAPGLVLVVDDEPLFRMLAAEALRDAGFEVVEAGTSGEALREICRGAPLCALVIDVEMRGAIDCRCLAWKARSMSPEIAVLIVTDETAAPRDELPDRTRCMSRPLNSRGLVAEVLKAVTDVTPG